MKTTRTTLLALTTALSLPPQSLRADAPNPCPSPPVVVRGWPPEPSPKLLTRVDPAFPSRSTPTEFASAFWIAEFDILTDGRVGEVRVLRHAKIDPPWPEWEDAISAAIRKWRYSVPCVAGKPRKLTMTILFDPVKRTFPGQKEGSDKK